MAIGWPEGVLNENGKAVKYVYRQVKGLSDEDYLTEDTPEDSHIDYWVGESSEDAPEGYKLVLKPDA